MDIATASQASSYPARTQPASHQSAGSHRSARDEPYYFKPFGDDGLTFEDVLDVINPLQHIPVISSLYREWTGDAIDPVARIAGGALFGGVVGIISSLVNVIVDEISGSDVGAHALAFAGDMLGIGDSDRTEMYAGAGDYPGADGDTLPVEVAGGAVPHPVADAIDVLDWPRLAADPAAGGAPQTLNTEPTTGVLQQKMAAVRRGQVTDVMVMAMSVYEKSEHAAKERIMPKIDILS